MRQDLCYNERRKSLYLKGFDDIWDGADVLHIINLSLF